MIRLGGEQCESIPASENTLMSNDSKLGKKFDMFSRKSKLCEAKGAQLRRWRFRLDR